MSHEFPAHSTTSTPGSGKNVPDSADGVEPGKFSGGPYKEREGDDDDRDGGGKGGTTGAEPSRPSPGPYRDK